VGGALPPVQRAQLHSTGNETGTEGGVGRDGAGCTLAAYANAKRLPVEFLRELGFDQITYLGRPAIRIPYRSLDGEELAVRFRIALDGDDRFRWRKGSKPCLYGLERLSQAREAGHLILVEGESDAQTLWLHGFPGLGLPGAGLWDEQRDAPVLLELAEACERPF
jgi:hypothetical protein